MNPNQEPRSVLKYELCQVGCWIIGTLQLLSMIIAGSELGPLLESKYTIFLLFLALYSFLFLVFTYLWCGDMIWLIQAENRRNTIAARRGPGKGLEQAESKTEAKAESKTEAEKEAEKEAEAEKQRRELELERKRKQDAKDLERGLMVIGLVLVAVLILVVFVWN